MLPDADVERFLRELADRSARHGVTVIGSFDQKVAAIMRGQPVELADGRLDRLIEGAMRNADAGFASPDTFF